MPEPLGVGGELEQLDYSPSLDAFNPSAMLQLCPWVVLVPSIPHRPVSPHLSPALLCGSAVSSSLAGLSWSEPASPAEETLSLMAALSYLSPPLLLRGPWLNLAQQEAGKGLDRAIFRTPCLTVIGVFKYWTSPAIGLWSVSFGERGKFHYSSQLSGTRQLHLGWHWDWQSGAIDWHNMREIFWNFEYLLGIIVLPPHISLNLSRLHHVLSPYPRRSRPILKQHSALKLWLDVLGSSVNFYPVNLGDCVSLQNYRSSYTFLHGDCLQLYSLYQRGMICFCKYSCKQ